MRRYIDAEDVEKRIDIVMGSEPKAWDKKALRELKMYVVHAVPTADVVEVVRCKDCKYGKIDSLFCCEYECSVFGNSNVEANDFCSYGELKNKP